MRIFMDCLAMTPTVSIGTQAFILANMGLIEECVGKAKFTMLSSYPEIGYHFCHQYKDRLEIVKRSGSISKTICDVISIKRRSDIIISAWGDGYISSPPHELFNKTFFFRSRTKPAVLFPSSIGPFAGGYKTFLAKEGLKVFDVVMARDTVTYDWLKQMGLKHVHLVPDTAFVLEPADRNRIGEILASEGVDLEERFIGLNISQNLNYLYKQHMGLDYAEFMAGLVRRLHHRYGLRVLLIPHHIYPAWFEHPNRYRPDSPLSDDRLPIRETMKMLGEEKIALPILGEYTPAEYKGIIATCEIFVGGRMHSAIGAVSSGVPAVLIQYSHKAPGVMDLVGLSQYVWDYKSDRGALFEMIDAVWEGRSLLRLEIADKIAGVKRDVSKAGVLLRDVLGKYGILEKR